MLAVYGNRNMEYKCRERLAKANAIEAAEIEEKKKKAEEEQLRISKLREIKAPQHEHEVEHVERCYTELSHKERDNTSPLLLDSGYTHG